MWGTETCSNASATTPAPAIFAANDFIYMDSFVFDRCLICINTSVDLEDAICSISNDNDSVGKIWNEIIQHYVSYPKTSTTEVQMP